MTMSPEVFAAECDAVLSEAMAEVRGLLGTAPRDQVLASLALMLDLLPPGQRTSIAATAMVQLADEQATHATTYGNFNDFAESAHETAQSLRGHLKQVQDEAIAHAARHAAIFDAHLRQVADLTDERDEARAEVVRLGKELERADLTNASMRAALDEADAE